VAEELSETKELPERKFAWWDMFIHENDDPRADGVWDNTERAVLTGFLSDRRLTLELKCSGLSVEQMARQSVPPSDLSLLGLVRHLAGVEQYWFRSVIAGEEVIRLYVGDEGEDVSFKVDPDPRIVQEAWETWRSEVAYAEGLIERTPDLGQLGRGKAVPVREVLVHLIREYAQHMGHADLLRERIDGRVGQ
jgi:Protein of unknown function (DUF664)